MKLLLDANVLIDLAGGRKPYVNDVRKLCVASTFGDVQLWVSVQSYLDAYYVLCRYDSEDNVKRALLATLEFFLPCGMNAADLKPSLESDWPDVEDRFIALTAKRLKADCLITRDEVLIERALLPTMTAADLLAKLETEQGLVYAEIDL